MSLCISPFSTVTMHVGKHTRTWHISTGRPACPSPRMLTVLLSSNDYPTAPEAEVSCLISPHQPDCTRGQEQVGKRHQTAFSPPTPFRLQSPDRSSPHGSPSPNSAQSRLPWAHHTQSPCVEGHLLRLEDPGLCLVLPGHQPFHMTGATQPLPGGIE